MSFRENFTLSCMLGPSKYSLSISGSRGYLCFSRTNTFSRSVYIGGGKLREIRSRKEPLDGDLDEARPACHGHERARLPPIFARSSIQSRFSKGPALQDAPSPSWTDCDTAIGRNPANLSPSHAPLRHRGRGDSPH